MSAVALSFVALVVAILTLVRAIWDDRRNARRLEELQNQAQECERRLRQRTILTNEVAHDIKNPITAILCSAEALDLLIGASLDDIHRKSLRYIKEYGDQLLQLVGDFLDISRAEAGMMQPRPVEISPAETIQSVLGLLEANAARKRISIKNFATDKKLRALADPKHFKQVLFNLIHNAVKFTPEGGEVHLSMKSEFPENFVRVSVSDNGPGIPPDQLEVLFDVYRRVEQNQLEGEAGSGLGLALCKSLVQMAGGSISVRCPRGGGTVIEFTIPAAAPSAEAEEPRHLVTTVTPSRSNLPLYGQSFLIVDDDAGARDSISRLIEAWGGLVDCVGEASEAVRALGIRDYDAVMIDTTGDGLRPHEVARLLRGDLQNEETTIIVAARSEDDLAAARESGADSVLEKPLNGERLLKSLLAVHRPPVSH